jgi:hypothetical protein
MPLAVCAGSFLLKESGHRPIPASCSSTRKYGYRRQSGVSGRSRIVIAISVSSAESRTPLPFHSRQQPANRIGRHSGERLYSARKRVFMRPARLQLLNRPGPIGRTASIFNCFRKTLKKKSRVCNRVPYIGEEEIVQLQEWQPSLLKTTVWHAHPTPQHTQKNPNFEKKCSKLKSSNLEKSSEVNMFKFEKKLTLKFVQIWKLFRLKNCSD